MTSETASILIFAAAEDPLGPVLQDRLSAAGRTVTVINKVAAGLGVFMRKPPQPPGLVIILGAVAGLPAASIARIVRGLPGGAGTPLILVGGAPSDLSDCTGVQASADADTICRLATGQKPVADAEPTAIAGNVFNPGVVRRMESLSRGAGREILDAMASDLRIADTELAALAQDCDLVSVRKLAHRVKGASGSIGADDLALACAKLEHAALRNDAPTCQTAMAEVRLAIARLLSHLPTVTL